MKQDEFYGESLADEYITIRKWVFNWKFPFIHRLVIREKLSELQKRWSKAFDLYLDLKIKQIYPPLKVTGKIGVSKETKTSKKNVTSKEANAEYKQKLLKRIKKLPRYLQNYNLKMVRRKNGGYIVLEDILDEVEAVIREEL